MRKTGREFSAEALGAKCSECPLKGQAQLAPLTNHRPKLVIVGEVPGAREIETNTPLAGAAGYALKQSLRKCKFPLSDIYKTNAILCQPPQGRKLKGKEWNKALECCRPRLEAELVPFKGLPILALGNRAMQSITGKAKVSGWWGAPHTALPPFHASVVMPSMHPSAALQKPGLLPVLDVFVSRACALARRQPLTWQWGNIYTQEDDAAIRAALRILASGEPVGVDVETAGVDPLTSPLITIGVSTADTAVNTMWPPKNEQLGQFILDILASDAVKVMHNGQHDALTLQHNDITLGGRHFDTMLAHSIVAPEVPHDLGFVACVEFPANRWKTEFRVEGDVKGSERFTAANADELKEYNAKDAMMTVRLHARLKKHLDNTHKGWGLFNHAMEMYFVAMNMRDGGAKIDVAAVAAHKQVLEGKMAEQAATFQNLTKDLPVQPRIGVGGAHPDLKKFFYGTLGVQPKFFSKETGEPSLDVNALERIVADESPQIKEFARPLLAYRKAHKLVSTYVNNLELDVGNYLHIEWKLHGTVTGRWSSSPNFQNWPKAMRNMVIPRRDKGWIVQADYSQLELRIMAILANDEKLLEWYANNEDVHTKTAQALFGTQSVTKAQRNMAKTIEYGFNYNISDDVTTVWRALVVNCPDLTMAQVKKMRETWFKEHPAIAKWQLEQIRKAEESKYVEEPISGRREYFHDSRVDPNKVLNFPVQGFAGTLMNRAVVDCAKGVDWSQHFIIAQVHDALYIDTTDVPYVAGLLKRTMEQEIELNGAKMKFPIDLQVSKNMKDGVDLATWQLQNVNT